MIIVHVLPRKVERKECLCLNFQGAPDDLAGSPSLCTSYVPYLFE